MTDDELAAELAAVLADRRAPHEVVEAAKGLFTWRTVDAELAALVEDSLVDDGVVTRAAQRLRSVTFEAGDTVLALEIDAAASRVVGQIEPAGEATVTVSDGAPVPADELGRFIAALPAAGVPLEVRIAFPDGRTVVTGPLAL